MKILKFSFFLILWSTTVASASILGQPHRVFLFGDQGPRISASDRFADELVRKTGVRWEIEGSESLVKVQDPLSAGDLKVILLDAEMISSRFFESLEREGHSLSSGEVVKTWWGIKFQDPVGTRREILKRSFGDFAALSRERSTIVIWRDGKWSANFPPSDEFFLKKNLKQILLPYYLMTPGFLRREMKKLLPTVVVLKAKSDQHFETLLASAIQKRLVQAP